MKLSRRTPQSDAVLVVQYIHLFVGEETQFVKGKKEERAWNASSRRCWHAKDTLLLPVCNHGDGESLKGPAALSPHDCELQVRNCSRPLRLARLWSRAVFPVVISCWKMICKHNWTPFPSSLSVLVPKRKKKKKKIRTSPQGGFLYFGLCSFRRHTELYNTFVANIYIIPLLYIC